MAYVLQGHYPEMQIPSFKTVLETVVAIAIFSAMGILFLALMVGWERVPQTIGILALAAVGFVSLFALIALLAGVEHISTNSQSRLLRGSAKLVMGVFVIACAVFMGWLIWNYLTDWIWRFPPCNTPGCRYD